MNFNFETQGPVTYLVCELAPNEELDPLTLGMLTNNHINGLAPVLYTELNSSRFLKYNISAKITANQFFSGTLSRSRALSAFSGILNAICIADDYMIDHSCFVIDPEHIFINVSSCEVALICVPVVVKKDFNKELISFFKNLINGNSLDKSQSDDYVIKILNYINEPSSFNVYGLKNVVETLANAQPAPSNAQNAQPAGIAGRFAGSAPQNQNRNQVKDFDATISVNDAPMLFGGNQAVNQPLNHPVNNFGGVPLSQPVNTPPVAPVKETGSKSNSLFGKSKPKHENKTQPKPAPTPIPNGANVPSRPPIPNGMNIPGKQPMPNGMNIPGKQPMPNGMNIPGKQPMPNGMNIPGRPPIPNGMNIPGKQPVPSGGQNSKPKKEKKSIFSLFGGKKEKKHNKKETKNPAQMPGMQNPPANQGAFQNQIQPLQIKPINPYGVVPPGNRQAVPVVALQNQFNETTVLDNSIGETTVLGTNPAPGEPYITRIKNGEITVINKPVFRIGKEKSYVDYFVSDNTAISRSHANIITDNGSYYIEDTNSTNHTYVNGAMVNGNQRVKLANEDSIRLANEEFKFYC